MPAPTKVVISPAQERKDRLVPLSPEEEGLFHALRTFRKQLADELGVPPYVVFADATLRALAHWRPQSIDYFSRMPGVGNRKLEAYYTPFTSEIRAYCEARNMEMDMEPPIRRDRRERRNLKERGQRSRRKSRHPPSRPRSW